MSDAAEVIINMPSIAGNPGGSPEAIGLFATTATHLGGSGFSIPAGIDVISTSGYSLLDRGAALYVHDPAVNSAFVAANPFSSFKSINGRGYRLSTEQVVSPEMFGALGDDSDDTAELSAFISFANANPGVRHVLSRKTYGFSSQLPSITNSNVWIEGCGTDIHDTGGTITGTVLHWLGGAAHSATGIEIAPVSGAGNQRLDNVRFAGIGFNCASGDLGSALSLRSICNSRIDVTTIEAFAQGVYTGCVATLGEAKDLQHNNIRIVGRQLVAPGRILTADGIGTANTSDNDFNIRGQIGSTEAVCCVDTDNNRWKVSVYAPGSATYGMLLNGGAVGGGRARAEDIQFYSCSKPIHVRGTDEYAVASTGHIVRQLDTENNTPAPTISVGASIAFPNSFKTYTPVASPSTGSITTQSGNAQYTVLPGGLVQFFGDVTITTNGTGAGTGLNITLPIPAAATAIGQSLSCHERNTTLKVLTASLPSGSSTFLVTDAGTYPGANGRTFTFSGTYRAIW